VLNRNGRVMRSWAIGLGNQNARGITLAATMRWSFIILPELSHPAKLHLAADKMVNGKPELMGEFDFAYDAAKKTLTTEFKIPRTGGTGVWLFNVDGDKIDGTLTVLPENEIGRRVNVARGTAGADKPH